MPNAFARALAALLGCGTANILAKRISSEIIAVSDTDGRCLFKIYHNSNMIAFPTMCSRILPTVMEYSEFEKIFTTLEFNEFQILIKDLTSSKL